MSLTSKEQKMLDFIASRQAELPQAISLYRMRYTGLVQGSDMYVADAMSRDHPFAEAMEGHAYLESLSDLGGFTLTIAQSGSYTSTTDKDYPANGSEATSTADFPVLGSYVEQATAPGGYSYETNWNSVPKHIEGGDWNVGASQTPEGIQFVLPAGLNRDESQFYGPTYVNMSSNTTILPVVGTYTLESFLSSEEPFATWVKTRAKSLPSGPQDLSEMSIDMGVHVLNLGSNAAVKIPHYTGYSTHVYIQPCYHGYNNVQWISVVFYRWGARKDTCVLEGIYQIDRYRAATRHPTYFEFDPSVKPAGTMTSVGGARQLRLFPMSGCPFFVNNYYGIAKPMVEVEQLMYDARMIVKIYEQEVSVTAVRGKLTYNELNRYFGTGYELFTPLIGDALTKTMESWAPYVETGLVFGIQPGSAAGYSLAKLPFYSEYARIRKKACRDNNFMSLMYDAQYTNKQVEAFLQQAGNIEVWCTNAALASTTPKDTSFNRTVLQVTKVTYNGVDMYAVQFPGELNSRKYVFTNEGAQQLLTEVIEADFGIQDTTGTLDLILGASDDGEMLSNVNTGSLGVEVSKFDMRMTSYNLGSAIVAADLQNQAGLVAATAYVAQQFTLFRQVRANIPFLISEFYFDKVWGSRIAK